MRLTDLYDEITFLRQQLEAYKAQIISMSTRLHYAEAEVERQRREQFGVTEQFNLNNDPWVNSDPIEIHEHVKGC